MTLFCKFKNLLGEPKKGFHSTRLFGFAAYDILVTIALGWGLSKITKSSSLLSIAGMFILGQILHYVFCVETVFMKLF